MPHSPNIMWLILSYGRTSQAKPQIAKKLKVLGSSASYGTVGPLVK